MTLRVPAVCAPLLADGMPIYGAVAIKVNPRLDDLES
jgi:hypothetical protein